MMVYVQQIKGKGDMVARDDAALRDRQSVLKAKPKKLSREQFEELHRSVTQRIPKTLAILAK